MQSHTRHFVEPDRFRLLLQYRQLGGHILVIDAFTLVVVGIRFRLQCPIVDIANTPEGLGEQLRLFCCRVEAKPIRFGCFHSYIIADRV